MFSILSCPVVVLGESRTPCASPVLTRKSMARLNEGAFRDADTFGVQSVSAF